MNDRTELIASFEGRVMGDVLHNGGYIHVPQEEAEQILALLKEQQKQRFFVDFDGKITPLPIQKHGNWIPIKTPTGVEYGGVKEYTVSEVMCSECGFTDDVSASIYTYCPECGVKMDKEEKQDDCNNPDKFASEGGA